MLNLSPFSIPEKHFVRLILHLQFCFWCLSSWYVWEFKQIKGFLSENCCTSQFVCQSYTRGSKRDLTPHWENAKKFIKYLKGPDRVEELIVVFNHNVINMHFTANNNTMYASYYDKVYELLWYSFHLFA